MKNKILIEDTPIDSLCLSKTRIYRRLTLSTNYPKYLIG